MKGKIVIIMFTTQILISLCMPQKVQEINNICGKIDNKHSSKINTSKDFLIRHNYDFEKEKNYSNKNKIYEFLIYEKIEEEDDYNIRYIKIIKKYLINLYIIPILLIWLIFIILFFFNACLFKSDLKINILLKLSTFIIIIIFILIIIFSFIVIWNTKKLQSSINDASCNLLKFFYELNYGKIKESNNNKNILNNDRWPGLFTLNSYLLDISEQIIKISNKKNDTFSFINEIKNCIENYQNLINVLNNQSLKGFTISNINQNDEEIIPIYLYEFKNISQKKTIINEIYLEYENFFLKPFNQLDYIYNYSNFLSYKSKVYDLQLTNIFDNISDYCYSIKEKSSSIINNIITLQSDLELIIMSIRIINRFSILLSLIIIFSIIIYFFKNLLWIKIFLHIFWNITFLIMIIYICICYFIVNLGEGVMNSIYLFENEILKTETNLFFGTCLNTIDSDLNILFNIYEKDSALIEIDKYYKRVFHALDILTKVKLKLPQSKKIKRARKQINNYLSNYELSTNSSYKQNDVTYILNKLSNITNNFKEGKQNGFCDSNDIWVSSKKKCKDYIFITRYEIKEQFIRKNNEKYCFIIQDDYDESDLKKIYGEICSDKAYNQIVKYVLQLTNYYNKNENLLESIEKNLKEINRCNKKLSEIIISQIQKFEDDIGDIIDIYKPILEDTNITNLFKCRSLKRNIMNYYDISYNQIVNYCNSIKIYLKVIIILGFLGIIFIIINNNRNSKEEKKRRYMKSQNKDLNNDGVELIEEVPGEDEDN